MKTPLWLAVVCLAASLPTQAQTLKPIELNDQELSVLRGRYVMPGRIVSFGVVMTSAWQNANGEVIGATSSMQISQSTIKPQFYVTMIDGKNTSSTQSQSSNPGTGSVTGGGGLNTTEGVTQVVRAAGDNNTAYNNVDINVSKASQVAATQPQAAIQPQGQALAAGSSLERTNGAGALNVAATSTGVQLNIVANNNQGSAMQRLGQGGLMQNTTLLGASNQVRNLTSLNIVLRDNVPTAGSLNGNLDQLRGLRTSGF
jgi:cytoskeletal protein RodZ